MNAIESTANIRLDDLYLDALARGARIEDLPSVLHADPMTMLLINARDECRQ